MKIEKIDKVFKYIYFLILFCIVSTAIYLTTVLIISPKNDLQNRGFIACTRDLVLNLGECKSGETGCVFKSFYKDTSCNLGVIADGFSAWIKGNQSTPWDNYIFEPEWQEKSENPYLSNPKEDMENMRLDREFILQKQQELENIKNGKIKANKEVIIFDPEFENIEEIVEDEVIEDDEEDINQDITEESLIGEMDNGSATEQKIEKLPESKIKNDSDKIAQKAKEEILK